VGRYGRTQRLLVRLNTGRARTDLGRLGANQGGLGAGERCLGALASGAGAGDRRASDGVRILESRLLGWWQLEHRTRLVERHLLDVSSSLGMVKSLLTDVPGGLLAIDPCLIVSKNASLRLAQAVIVLAQVFVGDLFLIDARLITVSDQLLPIPDGLLKIAQALFNGQLSLAWHARLSFDALVMCGAGGRARDD
jgi:hypothetical protein